MTTTTPPKPDQQLSRPQQQRLTLRKLFEQQKPELAKLLPRGMDPERLFRMALTECVKNPDLLECSAESWALAMQTCAAQGLYPDSGLGYMYLIPRAKQVTAQRGYQGDMKLARNTGEVQISPPEVVYEKDAYKVTKGLDPNIEHVPYDGDEDPGPLKAVYAVAKLKSTGEVVFVTLTKRDVMRHKAASAMDTTKPGSPWVKHEAEMWKKTAIHALFKWIPKDTEAMERAASAIAGDRGPIDTTAVDLGRVEVPLGEGGGALDRVAADLEGGGAPAGNAAPCEHPGVPKNIQPGQEVACEKCGEVLQGEPIAREPGSDDDTPTPPATVEDLKNLAAKAGDTAKGRPRQGRLTE